MANPLYDRLFGQHRTSEKSFLILPELVEFQVASGDPGYFDLPTPGALNGTGITGFAAVPRFSVERGFFETAFDLEITSTTPSATILYTTDGTKPMEGNGQVYTGPLRVAGTAIIRAAAFRDQYLPSAEVTHTYLFLEDVIRQSPTGAPPPGWPSSWGSNVVDYGMDPDVVNSPTYASTIAQDLTTIPSFSIVMNLADLFDSATGIYANPGQDGRDWERPCSLELIHPDGTEGFQVGAGIRIRGGFSRSTQNPKHAFRFFFREEYGTPELRYPLFGDSGTDTFDKIDLRTFQNYSWSFQGDGRGIFVRDQFNRDLQLAMGHQGERGDYYHLYINGQYWGLFNTCERPEASYGARYYGGQRDDYDTVKVEAGPYTINPTDGNLEAWTRLYQLARAGFSSDAAYEFVQGNNPDGTRNSDYEVLVDVPNLIDYMLIILYGGNLDAPISNFLGNSRPNNFYGLRDRTGPFGFRYFVHDAEHTLLNVNQNRIGPYSAGDSSVVYSNPQWFWQKLQAHPEFRMRIADHAHRHLFHDGVLTPQKTRDLFLHRTSQIDRAVVGESARWGDAKRATPFTRVNWLGAVNEVLNNHLPQRSGILLNQLRAAGLYPAVVAPVFNQHGGSVDPGFSLSMTAPAGVLYYTLDGTDPRLRGGAVSPGARIYAGPVILDETTTVSARVFSDGAWSAVNTADFVLIQTFTALLITEFHKDGQQQQIVLKIDKIGPGGDVVSVEDQSIAAVAASKVAASAQAPGRTASVATSVAAPVAAPVAQPMPQSTIPGITVRKLGHIEGVGDVVSQAGWLGDPTSGARLEGFAVSPVGLPQGVQLQYGVLVEGTQRYAAAVAGQFVGTRQKAKALVGVVFDLSGPNANQFRLSGQVVFAGQPPLALEPGVPMSGPSGSEHLVALALSIAPNATQSTAASAWDDPKVTRIARKTPATAQKAAVKKAPAKKALAKKAVAKKGTATRSKK